MTAAIVCARPPGATAQSIQPVGTAATFDIATWNIEWFGYTGGPSDDELQLRHVIDVMRASQVDFWAVQEIADSGFFTRLVDSLGVPYEGTLATESGQQRVGFIYNTDLIAVRTIQHVLASFSSDFAGRPPLQLEADVTVADSTRRLTFITVHMKCCGSTEDHERRLAASTRLKNHIDFTTLANKPVIVLGDFNDELGASITGGRDTPYRNFLDDPARYRFATLPLDEANISTYCSSSLCTVGSTLDHILISNELFADLESGTTDRYESLPVDIPGYVSNTSDHLPVFARLRYGISTAAEGSPDRESVNIGVAYPNPATSVVTVPVAASTAACTSTCQAEIFDSLGRKAAVVPLSQSGFEVDVSRYPPGLYFARVTVGARAEVRLFVVGN